MVYEKIKGNGNRTSEKKKKKRNETKLKPQTAETTHTADSTTACPKNTTRGGKKSVNVRPALLHLFLVPRAQSHFLSAS